MQRRIIIQFPFSKREIEAQRQFSICRNLPGPSQLPLKAAAELQPLLKISAWISHPQISLLQSQHLIQIQSPPNLLLLVGKKIEMLGSETQKYTFGTFPLKGIIHTLILEQAKEIPSEGKVSSWPCSPGLGTDLFRFSTKSPSCQPAQTDWTPEVLLTPAAAFLSISEVSEGPFPLLDSLVEGCSCNYHPSSQKNKISLILHLKINSLLSRKEPNHHLTSWKWSFVKQ